ncbi:unnamed protein product [Cylicocyclus nassatus]|uniref:Uncharacterized protein n=1 Tax=Cylicocyclus nassatus TaxID=53992 RepID=A0AA36GYN9_CYLNA|nr:unnamed protein product [Cylicocyclus nassatus]
MSCISFPMPLPLPPVPPVLPETPKKKMCEEISYDEIYMPSELDGGSNEGTRRQSTDVEAQTPKNADDEDREPGEVKEEKTKSAVHPPEEVSSPLSSL